MLLVIFSVPDTKYIVLFSVYSNSIQYIVKRNSTVHGLGLNMLIHQKTFL